MIKLASRFIHVLRKFARAIIPVVSALTSLIAVLGLGFTLFYYTKAKDLINSNPNAIASLGFATGILITGVVTCVLSTIGKSTIYYNKC